ncbi:FecR family protein [Luteibacter aegosomaticola]|uniref:FecR family protein n=1 Tax=Luteibacter aegosomaticola TaxID=2911538 RepID=UPI001FF80C5F|nr:FecR family protein [Luteibacter aegosomaticola]UPG91197.1 FecR family protein [Luteibacter aegosomaticola]
MRPPRHRLAATAMPSSTYSADARQQAAGWVIRLDAGDLTAPERAAFDAWLAADPTHGAALERARTTWRELDLLASGLNDMESVGHVTPAPGGAKGTRPRAVHAGGRTPRKRRHPALIAACALLVVAISAWQYPRVSIALRADARTAVGETQRIALVGGGVAQLDSGSAISLHDDAQWRDVQVLSGAVSFEVGHDDPRPFRVRAGRVVVTDVGTTFQLRLDGDATDVVVASGEVEVAAPGGKVAVHSGESASLANDNKAPSVSPVDADAAMAWTRGRLMFVDRPLKDVIAELNRYYPGHIVLADDAAGDRRVSGVFRTNDPLAALRAIEANLGLHATHVAPGLILL